MTWAERFGDVATNLALVLINAARLFTYFFRLLARLLDDFVTRLGEATETGLRRTGAPERAIWVRILAGVFLSAIRVILVVISIVTVLVRQATETVDEFFRMLAEGEGATTPTPGPGP